MRTYALYGMLALAGCASPEAAFPDLTEIRQPEPPATTALERQALLSEIQRAGDVTRTAGRMVREGETSGARLPR